MGAGKISEGSKEFNNLKMFAGGDEPFLGTDYGSLMNELFRIVSGPPQVIGGQQADEGTGSLDVILQKQKPRGPVEKQKPRDPFSTSREIRSDSDA